MAKKLTDIKKLRLDSAVDTEELQSVLSKATVWKIEKGIPVSYKSAVLYCRALGVDPREYIIERKAIAILEEPEIAS